MTIEERLAALEAERAILHTLHAYGHAIDYGDEQAFLDCWMPDARLTYSFAVANERGSGEPRDPMRFEGHDEIAGFFRAHTHAPDRYHKHFLAAPLIVIDGERATAECYNARLDEQPGGPRMSSFGRYRDVLVACEDGRWRFVSRESETESRAS